MFIKVEFCLYTKKKKHLAHTTVLLTLKGADV